MGGGDLNLKKSWHPSTLRNIERVWKAEQKHEVEQQKIEQLQKELAEERAREEIQSFAEDTGVLKKKDERLDWMYQGPAAMVNRDDYLLGKKIDKTLETLTQVEKGGEPEKEEGVSIASNSMFNSQNVASNATVDLAAKIREDPLFSIMKKEKEERKNLLTNPVKMKQLQEMLKASLGKSKSKKSKKSKKKKHQESDSEEEPRTKKQRKHHQVSDQEKQHKKQKKHKKSYSSESEEDTQSSDDYKRYFKQGKEDNGMQKSCHKGDRDTKYYDDTYSKNLKYGSSHQKNSHSLSEYKEFKHIISNEKYYSKESKSSKRESSTYDYETSSKNRRHRSSSSPEYSESRHKTSHHKDVSSRNGHSLSSKEKTYERKDHNRKETDKKKKLDASEREHLLKEMQDNARWRDEQRKRNTERYREEEERERRDTVENVGRDAFLKPILSKAAGKGNLEDRLKQKIFTIQRSSSAMDKNFAKRD